MKKSPKRSYKLKDWDGSCICCGKSAPDVSFGSGMAGECGKCAKARWSAENIVKIRAQRLYGNAQKRSKQLGFQKPDFDSKWIEEKILNGVCEATGIKFDLTTEKNNSCHAKNPFVPSIDRTDSSKPYVKENVKLVVFMYNVCKSEFSHDDVIKFCKAVLNSGNCDEKI